MFDQILGMVKEHIGNNPQVKSAIPPGKEDAVHHEIATQVTKGLAAEAGQQGGVGGMLSKLQNAATSGSPVVNAIEGGLVATLGSKFGLPPMATGAIAAALPGLLQKFAHRAYDPNDHSITHDGISDAFSKITGSLGSMFNK
ncbi:MAG: hypothetical protein JWN76_1923 [Chitinophagaceae bacterium]|nr:hypothetical protein [Chitinophagaceae bacterium]